MGKDTTINWARHTFNPWLGCTHVSEACRHCYAEAWAHRFGKVEWGPTAIRKRTAPQSWKEPFKWDIAATNAGERHGVFCASLADVFDDHESIQPVWRQDLWNMIETTSSLEWLLLTKRPQNWSMLLPSSPLENVTLGVTIEDQRQLDECLPYLDDISMPWGPPFVSYEPALGPIDWDSVLKHVAIDCIISGGGSGGEKRPSYTDWHRATRDACAKWGVRYNFKQWGNWMDRESLIASGLKPKDIAAKDGAALVAWDDAAAPRSLMVFVGDRGKKERTLDGRTHNKLPGGLEDKS